MEPYTQIASDPKVSKLMQNNTMVDLVKGFRKMTYNTNSSPSIIFHTAGFTIRIYICGVQMITAWTASTGGCYSLRCLH